MFTLVKRYDGYKIRVKDSEDRKMLEYIVKHFDNIIEKDVEYNARLLFNRLLKFSSKKMLGQIAIWLMTKTT